MDVHQRLSGALMLVLGLLGLVAVAIASIPLQISSWFDTPQRFGALIVLGVTLLALMLGWSLAALAGGLAAACGAHGGARLLIPAAFPLLVFLPIGTLIGLYVLWAFWRKSAARPLPAWKRIALKTR